MGQRNMIKIICKFLIVILILKYNFAYSQKPISGPFVGSVTCNSAKIWVANKKNKPIEITLKDNNSVYYGHLFSRSNQKNKEASIWSFDSLPENTILSVLCNGQSISNTKINVQFKTQKTERNTDDIKFLAGSCALMLHRPLSVFFPGASRKIFNSMSADSCDFMVWMGDNIYLLGFHLKSEKRVFRKNMNVRTKFKKYDHLLSSQPNYSIWDDHDFGPNNTDGSFFGKNYTTKVFNQMWPNHTPAEPENGNYYSFKQGDAQFFMLDDRSNKHISDSLNTCLGDRQIKWLEMELKKSDANFKFIVNGNQVIKKQRGSECLRYFKDEFENIMSFIKDERIDGIMFLSGDIHHTELLQDNDIGNYPIFELTCSPMTSKISGPPKDKSQIVDGTLLLKKRNYAVCRILGSQSSRQLEISTYNIKGELIWVKTISLGEISNK